MIGQLPKELNVNGKKLAIRSDFRVALLIFTAYNDVELIENEVMQEKTMTMLNCLYENFSEIPYEDYPEAIKQGIWYLDGGGNTEESTSQQAPKKVMDWEQDEQLIFSAVNKVAGYETRATEYLHWWTFLGLFNEIGEGLFSAVVNIRTKKNKHKKLEKHEKEFYKENRSLIDLKVKLTEEEKADLERLNKLLNS